MLPNPNYQPNMRQIQPNMDPARSASPAGAMRMPYWPTIPAQSTRNDLISQVRFYSTGLAPADADNVINTQATREIRFNIPCIILAFMGTCTTSDGSGLPAGWAPNDCYEVLFTVGSGTEFITMQSRLASTVVGTASRPGFAGAGGYLMPQASFLSVGITPRLPGLAAGVTTRIDITVAVMELRSGSSYVLPGM